jgi:hypothetical protein
MNIRIKIVSLMASFELHAIVKGKIHLEFDQKASDIDCTIDFFKAFAK